VQYSVLFASAALLVAVAGHLRRIVLPSCWSSSLAIVVVSFSLAQCSSSPARRAHPLAVSQAASMSRAALSQAATLISFGSLAIEYRKHEETMEHMKKRLAFMARHFRCPAASQAKSFESTGLCLATLEQVQDPDFARFHNIGLFVSVVGAHNATVQYPSGIPSAQIPIMWVSGRGCALDDSLPRIVETLRRGQVVCVHCLNSFHRAPIAYAAILKRIFGLEVHHTMCVLSARRRIHPGHLAAFREGDKLSEALRWASQLAEWCPEQDEEARTPPRAASQDAPGGEWLFRCMCGDKMEFAWREPPRVQGEDLARLAVHHILEGSPQGQTSPFLHMSWGFPEARRYFTSSKFSFAGEPFMARLRVRSLARIMQQDSAGSQAKEHSAASQANQDVAAVCDGPVGNGRLLDFSSMTRALRTIGRHATRIKSQRILFPMSPVFARQEVLITWRGQIPSEHFEVIDQTSGVRLRGLGDFLTKAAIGARNANPWV
jgi:hypothetical protein